MTTAGQQLVAGRVPGERIATQSYDTDSGTFTTTVTSIASVTASLVSGRIYRVRFVTHIGTSSAGDECQVSIYEDSTAGTELQSFGRMQLPNAGVAGNYVTLEAEYTAAASGSKTFVGAASRITGAGNLRREAATTRPTYLYVDYIRG